MKNKMSPRLKYGIINRYIGREDYSMMSRETKIFLFQQAMQKFYNWQVEVFGSRYNYNKYLIIRNGFDSIKEYLDEWAKSKGLKDYSEYNRKYAKGRREKLKELGLCVNCKEKLDTENIRCSICSESHRVEEKIRHRKNLTNSQTT